MKKWLSGILSVVMLCTVLGGGASLAYAATTATSGSCGDNVKYNIDTGTGVLTLTGSGATNNYSATTINIGTSVKRCPWYSYKDSVKRVVIGEGVTVLGNYLFYQMTSVQTVILPSSITEINRYAFAGCTALSAINLQDTTITKIGMNAFENDTNFTTLRLPETLTEISDFAFRKAGINSVTFPEKCSKIGISAFAGCSFVSLTLPETIRSVGTTAFSDNSFLLDVYVENPNLDYGSLDPFANCQSALTFHATGGSTTQAYAENKGYNFSATDSDCDHAETHTVVTQAATCTAKGKQDVYCSKCLKYLRTEDIAATGHDLQVIQTDDQSEKNGHIFEYLRCVKCNDESTDTIRATHVKDEDGNYVWLDGCYADTVLTEAGCTSTGRVIRRCTVEEPTKNSKCTAFQYINTPAPGHTVEEWTVVVPATCTTDGQKTGVCTVCHQTIAESISAGHDYQCTEGETDDTGHRIDTYICSVCGDSYTTQEHVEWVEGYYDTRVITQASCLVAGSSLDTCRYCKTTRTNVVPMYGHDFRFVSCDGTDCSYQCSRCTATRTNTLTNVDGYFFDNMGHTADKLLGYYYDVNNDGYVNLRDYVLIQRMLAGIGITQTETTNPDASESAGTDT